MSGLKWLGWVWAVASLVGMATFPNGRAEDVEYANLCGEHSDAANFYVVLCARESPSWGTGHSFIVWIEDDVVEGAKSVGYGFYPGQPRIVSRLFFGRGAVIDETSRSASVEADLLTHRLVLRVDREAYLKSRDVLREWSGSQPGYNLLSRNCTHFTFDVARAVGLDLPPPNVGELPPAYLERALAHVRATSLH